jgi:hypothetical protein
MGKETLVLYVPPKPPGPRIKDKVEYRWSFDTEEGRREYEAALAKHLQANRILLGATTFEPLSSSADIAKLADSKFAKLVLIVHGAGDAPAIAVDLGNAAAGIKGDWIKANEFAAQIAAFGFENVTILGCDAVGNKFAPNLAKALPKGSTVTGHKGPTFEITNHYDFDKKVPGHLLLTHLISNLNLQSFKTEGNTP